jgi:hypothetical protein
VRPPRQRLPTGITSLFPRLVDSEKVARACALCMWAAGRPGEGGGGAGDSMMTARWIMQVFGCRSRAQPLVSPVCLQSWYMLAATLPVGAHRSPRPKWQRTIAPCTFMEGTGQHCAHAKIRPWHSRCSRPLRAGAHYNPAITIAVWLRGKTQFIEVSYTAALLEGHQLATSD